MFLMAQGRWVTKTGPNDARCVVWAISKFLFFFKFPLCLILTIILRYYLCF